VHFDVALHRAVSLAISVTNPDGQPAAEADVGLVSSGGHLTLLPGGFSQNDSGANLLRTDVAGHFSLTSDDAITSVIVASPSGYAETSLADLQTNPAIILQAWGRIEGTCLSGGQPVAGREYTLDLFNDNADSVRADFMAFHVVSDGQGKFVMPMVPPGKHYLVRQLRSQVSPGGMGWIGGDKTEVNVSPGQTTPVTFGNNGYKVTVTIQWPAGAPPADIQQMMVSLHTPQPALPAQIVGHPDLIRQYHQSPEFQAIARTLHRYPMAANAGGTFEADDVPAGNYQLSAFVILQPQPGQQSELMTAPGISVTIPSDPPIGQLDAGTIEMQPTAQQAKRM
jgi:hypothetical protein